MIHKYEEVKAIEVDIHYVPGVTSVIATTRSSCPVAGAGIVDNEEK